MLQEEGAGPGSKGRVRTAQLKRAGVSGSAAGMEKDHQDEMGRGRTEVAQ